MATDIGTLEKRYFDACKRLEIPPNKSVVAALFKAKIKKARHEVSSLMVSIDDLKDVDFYPFLDLLTDIDSSEIDVVDFVNSPSCVLNGEYVYPLLHAVNKKLRFVDIHDTSFGKDFLLYLSQRGLACQVLNLRSSHFRKLNMVGNFTRMCTLNLDFSASLTSFREDCFSCMPNLRFLSLCETRIGNLWTTSAALAKLPSLAELRFQNCVPYSDTKGSHASLGNENNEDMCSSFMGFALHMNLPLPSGEVFPHLQSNVRDEAISDDDDYIIQDTGNMNEDSSDDSEVDFSGHPQEFGFMELLPNRPFGWDDLVDMHSEISFGTQDMQNEDLLSDRLVNFRNLSCILPKKYVSRHASPICYEKHYREYMIASLPNLKVLDNLPIGKVDREKAHGVFTLHFEYLPYNRNYKESVVSVLRNREIGANFPCTHASKKKFSSSYGKSQYFYSRCLSAAKMGSSEWPSLHPLSITGSVFRDERRNFRPRQFEYHPSDSSLMAVGTLDGEVVVINHESEKIVSYIPSLGAMNSVLGICWLKNYPSKLIAGSDNGSLRLYDVQRMAITSGGIYDSRGCVIFDEFDQLTSVNINSTDELFLASGYSKHVALYDISSGRRIQIFADMHREHINVVKFSNHSPYLFATSSFDQDVKMWDLRQRPNQPCYTASSSRGNVMVCFSPDDHYLLVSAVDNEVKQLLAVDGRLHLDFGIASTGSSQNYTRSYYMNGRDYVISGSCDEHVVRVCCAQTGRRLRDVSLEGKGAGTSMFVQSLRGDPFRDFNMSILAAYVRPSSNSEIFKVNLLAPNDNDKTHPYAQQSHSINGMGG
ncbi:protein DWD HYPERSENSITIVE TO UV-B 1 isoform X2 [Primulina huaijiensis]|uniref:protein DWD HYPERSENSITIVE TO UV-B 1 isoform X2 n=1 Tax=Primulina huaijiensis TaxID=1492673 RepID=UPI003CC6ED54